MTNVLIGKFGKVISFNADKWGMTGGDSESAILISCMAQCYPDVNFYIASRNDYDTLDSHTKNKINKNNNLHDAWKNYSKDLGIDNQDWLKHYFETEGIELDFGLIYGGVSAGCTIPNSMYLITEPDKVATPMSSSKRSVGIIAKFLNDSGLPYFEIGEDPRYLPVRARDIFNRSKKILGGANISFTATNIKDYLSREMVETVVPCVDIEHHLMFLMNENRDRLLTEPGERKTLANEACHYTATQDGSIDKWEIIKTHFLEHFPDVMIYGKWDAPKVIKGKYKDQFKEIPMKDLHDVMYDTKYTLVIGGSTIWGTQSKFWKMLIFGIIPFFVEGNDPERVFNAPEFLYTKGAKDFKEKIDFLENDKTEYMKLWNECQQLIHRDDLWDGSYFFNNIEREIKEEFGVELNRTGTIEYKSSSIFLHENENTLTDFFK